jgi:hypothetical protein
MSPSSFLSQLDFLDDVRIRTIYMGCAIVGGAILSLQMILLLFGGDIGADTDVDDIGDHGDGLGVLSIRSMASFMTFFGLTGLWGLQEQWGPGKTGGVALGAGLAALLIVAWVMSMMTGLTSDGNLDPENVLGQAAKVYLRIPGEGKGKGKITVSIQGRTQEYEATTQGSELATGAAVRILRQTTPNTFEVEAL